MAEINEPILPGKPLYPYNSASLSESGHLTEIDDTPGRERVRHQHKAGTFVEWQPDGTEVHKIVGNGFRIVVQDDNVIIEGKCNISIAGNAEISIGGDAITHVAGSSTQVVEKDYNLVVKGNYNLDVTGDLNLSTYGTSSDLMFQSAGRLVLDTDLTVHGEVLADSIHSTGAVTAGTGIHAGVPGSANPTAGISTLGGLNIGTAGPTIPGTAVAVGEINAGVSVYGPMVSDMFGSMEAFRLKVDQHHHIGNKGWPTSPPTSPMEG